MRAVYILWIRQLKRYVRKKSRIVGALGQPILFLIALGFGFGPIYARAGGGDYIQFLAPGIIGMTVLFTAIFTATEIIWDKQFGFLKETLVAPVSRFEVMLGRTLGGATVATVQGLIVLTITFIAGFRPYNIWLIPVAIFFIALISLLFSAFGSVIAARLDDMQAFPLIINFIVQPLFFLSGALFPIDQLPDALKFVTTINPLSFGIEGIRRALTGASFFSYSTDIIVLSALSLILLTIGAYQFNKIEV